jgi:hypothetical protein
MQQFFDSIQEMEPNSQIAACRAMDAMLAGAKASLLVVGAQEATQILNEKVFPTVKQAYYGDSNATSQDFMRDIIVVGMNLIAFGMAVPNMLNDINNARTRLENKIDELRQQIANRRPGPNPGGGR